MLNSSSDLYSKAKFLSKVCPDDCKGFLETLKVAHHNGKTQHKLAMIFKSEGLLASAILEKDPQARTQLVRKEMAALTGKVRGVGTEDILPDLLAVAQSKLS